MREKHKRIQIQIIVVNIERTPAKRYRYASIHAHIKQKRTQLVYETLEHVVRVIGAQNIEVEIFLNAIAMTST